MSKKPTATQIVAFLKDQYMNTYEGEWEEFLEWVSEWVRDYYTPVRGVSKKVVDVRVEVDQ